MLYKNAYIFQGTEGFVKGSLRVLDGRIEEVLREDASGLEPSVEVTDPDVTDLEGLYVIPGLIDIHTHGNSGYDFSDGDPEGLRIMGEYYARHGITSFAPASMTLPYEVLEKAFQTAREYTRCRPDDAARLVGIHMEGPFFSEKKRGAQNSAYLKLPDAEAVRRLQEAFGGLIRIVDVAPELPGAEAFIWEVAPICRVSVAHTESSFEEAVSAFDAGALHVTHLFNGMPPLHHRSPGVIGAAFDRGDVTVELICDGLHIHPAVIRLVFMAFAGRVCLVSDSMRCCGMPDGDYELGGQKVYVRDRKALLADGTLAGSVLNLYDDMVNAIRFGIPAEQAILAATLIPAKVIGEDREAGSLKAGKRADFVLCDRDWKIRQVVIGGKTV